jgi:hypothetical protein
VRDHRFASVSDSLAGDDSGAPTQYGCRVIDHVVLLALREDTTESKLSRLGDMLAALPGRIDGLNSVRYGANTSPEGLGQGYTYGFVIGFEDEAARDRYLPHPEHLPVSAMVQQLSERVLVFDIPS